MVGKNSYSKVVKTGDLSGSDRESMFQILGEHFSRLSRVNFDRDLNEKDWVVVVCDSGDQIEGFSTLKLLTQEFEGEIIHAFFSGDTVLSKRFSGDPTWIPVWGDHVFAEAELMMPEKSYWLLLTATHRTYRILPTCFNEYIPNAHKPSEPRLKKIMDNFIQQKFPNEYDKKSGLVILKESIPYKQFDDAKAQFGNHHFYTDYFKKLNPEFMRGDFLCCLTEIRSDNLNRAGVRVVYGIRPVVGIS